MDELESILEETISFSEKYKTFSTKFEPKDHSDEFWSQEEMTTCFVYDGSNYMVQQVWSRTLFHNHYSYTIYKDGKESDIDMFCIMSVYAVIRAEKARGRVWKPYEKED